MSVGSHIVICGTHVVSMSMAAKTKWKFQGEGAFSLLI